MSTNNEQTTKNVSYDTVAKYFSEEAVSLISDTAIAKTLAAEKMRFENATILQISPLSIVGNNTARHCKDLLRKNQPLSFLYTLLCFLSEVSILMLLYGLILNIGIALFSESGFFSAFTYLYEFILFSGVMAGITVFRKQLNTVLAIPFSKKNPADTEILERKKLLKRKRILSLAIILAIMAVAAGVVTLFDLQSKYTINITICFFAYIICMLLFGIHNVIYNSHMISFLTIGGLRLLKKPSEAVSSACKTYLDLSYLQILSQAHKTLDDCRKNPELLDKLKKSVYARTVTGRIYCLLAMITMVILDIICLLQLQGVVTVAFWVFFIAAILLTWILLIAIVSANYVLKQTKSI